MALDKAEWHSEGYFPQDLPPEAGATHMGMFFAWVCLSGHAGDAFLEDFEDDLQALRNRDVTPGAFVLATLDGTLSADDLSAEMARFANAYYDGEKKFLGDYCDLLVEDGETAYHVPDTWETFDTLKPMLDKRFLEWKRAIN